MLSDLKISWPPLVPDTYCSLGQCLSSIGALRPWFTAFLSTHAQDSVRDDLSIHMYDFSSSLPSQFFDTLFLFFLKLITLYYLYLCDPMDCRPPGSSVHGISQARILEWMAISSSRGSSWPRDRTLVSSVSYTLVDGFFTIEPHGKPWHFIS